MQKGFLIANLRLGEKTNENVSGKASFRLFLRQSESQNRNSEIDGDCCSRYRIRNVWRCGAGAAANENPPAGYSGTCFSVSFGRGPRSTSTGLRELGYIEGKNLIIEYRYANGKLDLLSSLANDLVALKIDVIVTRSTGSIRAMNASKTIPIIFPSAGAPSRTELLQAWQAPVETSPG